MAKQTAFDALIEGNLQAEVTGQTNGVPRISIYQLTYINGLVVRDQLATFYSPDAFTLAGGYPTVEAFNTSMRQRREALHKAREEGSLA